MSVSRRAAIAAGVIGIGVLTQGASCSLDVADLEKKLAAIITQVQAAVKAACGLVPTADTVIAVLIALVGTAAPDVAALAALVQQAIDTIAKACPAPNTPPTLSVPVKDKDVPIVFY